MKYVQRARTVRAGHRTYMEVHLGVRKAKQRRNCRCFIGTADGNVDGESFSGVARYSESVYSLWIIKACTV